MRGIGKRGSALVAGATAAVVIGATASSGALAAWNDQEFVHAPGMGALDCIDGGDFATEAWAKMVSAYLGATDLATAADVEALRVTNAAPDTDADVDPDGAPGTAYPLEDAFTSPLSLEALGTISLPLAVPLFPEAPATEAGAYTQFAQALESGQSTGAAGLITDTGGVIGVGTPDPGTPEVGAVELDGVVREAVGEEQADFVAENVTGFGMNVGAVASVATLDACMADWDDEALADAVQRSYLVDRLGLGFGSPLIAGLGTTVQNLLTQLEASVALDLEDAGTTPIIEGLEDAINGLEGLALGSLASLDVTSISVALDLDFSALQTFLANGTTVDGVTVNLTTGEVTVDLETALGADLNGQPPNTPVLTEAVLDDILGSIDDALTAILDQVDQAIDAALTAPRLNTQIVATTQLLGQTLDLALQISGTAAELTNVAVTDPVVNADLSASGLVPGILNAALALIPLAPTLDELLDGLEVLIETAIVAGVLPGDVSPLLAGLIPDLVATAEAVVALALPEGVLDPILGETGLGGVFELLDGVLNVTLNVQPDQPGAPSVGDRPLTEVADRFQVSALSIVVLGLGEPPVLDVYLASSAVGPNVPR